MALSGPSPKYYQVSQSLRQQILSGALAPDTQIPAEDKLVEAYGVSRGTVRKAVRILEAEGLLRREQGRGTFINPPRTALNSFSLVDFEQYVLRQNRQPSTQTLVQEVIGATDEIAARLALEPGHPVIHIAQLRLADRIPVIFEERYVDQRLCPDLLNDNLDTQSVHWLLLRKYNLPLIRVAYTVEVRQLPPDQAALLRVDGPLSAFYVDRLTTTHHDGQERPAVWYRALYRTDDDQFQAEFQASV